MKVENTLVLMTILFLVTALSGCATIRQMSLVDFQTGQTIEGEINESTRIITVTMPNGEVLSGTYSAVASSSPVYETGIGVGAGSHSHGTVFGTGVVLGASGGPSKGYGLLRSSSSGLMMEIEVSYSEVTGHGYGEAVTNDGRKYKVQF